MTFFAAPLRAQDTSTDASQSQRILGVLPNFGTVENAPAAPPITTSQRFRIASLNTFDPFVYPFVGLTAGLADLQRQEGNWRGAVGYSQHYAVAFADNTIGNMLTTAVVPTLVNQDPRYFVLGKGGLWHRAGYAASRSLVTRGANGQHQFNISELGGNALAAGLSNLYYPADARSLYATLQRFQTQVMWDTLANELKEFWPDIRRTLLHR